MCRKENKHQDAASPPRSPRDVTPSSDIDEESPDCPLPQVDLLPTREEDDKQIHFTVRTVDGIPEMVVGPRWWDLQDPTQPWTYIFKWGPGSDHEGGHKPSKGGRYKRSRSCPRESI